MTFIISEISVELYIAVFSSIYIYYYIIIYYIQFNLYFYINTYLTSLFTSENKILRKQRISTYSLLYLCRKMCFFASDILKYTVAKQTLISDYDFLSDGFVMIFRCLTLRKTLLRTPTLMYIQNFIYYCMSSVFSKVFILCRNFFKRLNSMLRPVKINQDVCSSLQC